MRNLKKALSLALASVMVLGMMVVGSSAKASPDVTTEHNVEAIELVKVLGIMNGDNAGNWNPEQTLTRNELAIIIAKLANLPLNGNHPFTDVPTWADKYVGALYANGITTGTSATTYGGAQQVTTVEAALMMERVVGYMNMPGELKFHGGFAMGTSKIGQKIGLFEDVNSMLTGPVTRNNIAQMVKNLLNAELVVANKVGGAEVTSPDMSVTVPATFTYDNVKSKYIASGVILPKTLMEKVYDVYSTEDTTLKHTVANEYGEPVVYFTYNGKTSEKVITSAPVLTYTGKVEDGQLLKDLGLKAKEVQSADAAKDSKVTIWTDGRKGVSSAELKDLDKAKNEGKTALVGPDAGILTEVYKNTVVVGGETYYTITLVLTTTKLTTVTSGPDSEGKITVASKQVDANGLKADDVVLYTLKPDGEIRSVEKATKLTGKVTKIVANTDGSALEAVYVDGTKYPVAATALQAGIAANVTDSVEYYLINGAIVKMESPNAVVENHALVVAIDQKWGTNNYAKLVLADGTQVEAQYIYDSSNDKKFEADVDTAQLAVNDVVKYTVKDGVYLIGNADKKSWSSGSEAKNVKIDIADDGSVLLNDKTVIVIKDGDKYVTVTGVKNVPAWTKDSAKAVYLNNKTVFVIKAGTPSNVSAKDTIFVVDNDAAKKESEIGVDGKAYSFFTMNAVVNGEIKTVKVDTVNTLDANKLYTSVVVDKNGVITGHGEEVDGTVSGGIVKTDIKDGTMKIGTAYYSYDANTKAYKVDGAKIKAVAVSELAATGSVAVKNDAGMLTAIYAW